jgi:Uma2 family endonuclease
MGALDSPLVQRHRLTVDEYHRMGEAGVLQPDARVELIDGEIVDMAPIGTRHAAAVKRINLLLSQAIGGAPSFRCKTRSGSARALNRSPIWRS